MAVAGPDSGVARPAPAPRRPSSFSPGRLLARIGNIRTDASFSQSSSYNRVTGTPDFFYLFGLRPNPGDYGGERARVHPAFGNSRTIGRDIRVGAQTRVSLPLGLSLQTRADYSQRAMEANGLTSRQRTHHYPYVDVEYGMLAKMLRLDRLLQRPQIRTTFDRNRVLEFAPGSDSATGIANSVELRPLVSVSGELKNQTRVDLRVDYRNSTRENRLNGLSTEFDGSVDAKLDLSRQYTQGQKVSFLGKETVVRSSVTLGLSAVYSRLNRETRTRGLTTLPTRESRMSFNANGSYGFSDNVYGNAQVGFSQTHDLVRDLITRTLRVELRAQFTF